MNLKYFDYIFNFNNFKCFEFKNENLKIKHNNIFKFFDEFIKNFRN